MLLRRRPLGRSAASWITSETVSVRHAGHRGIVTSPLRRGRRGRLELASY